MDTVEIAPFRPSRRRTALVITAAGLAIGVCGTIGFSGAITRHAADHDGTGPGAAQ
jgi:hypothetical protein